MKPRFVMAVFLILALAAPASMLAQGSKDEQQIRAIGREMTDAFLKGGAEGAAVLERIYAEDYKGIRGDGRVLTKAQEIEAYKSGAIKYQANEAKEAKIHVYGNSAVSTSLAFSSGTRQGTTYSGMTRNARFWVKRHGNWKCVYYQTTRVLESATAQASQNPPLSHLADPAAYKLVSENEQFRVVMVTKPVGSRDAWHSHLPNVTYNLTDCHQRTYTPDGQSREGKRDAGSTVLQAAISSHSTENIGTAECRQLMVERK